MIGLRIFFLAVVVAGHVLYAEAVERPYVKIARFRGDTQAAVTITFDDGYPGQIERAIPIFNKHGLRATFFIHTDNVKDSWSANWAAWKVAAEQGHEVGSHTKTHPDLTHVRKPRQLRSEIEGSADLIEQRVGIRPISFAYPFSASDDVIQRQVRDVYLLDRSDCRMWGGEQFSVEEAVRNIEQAVEKGVWFFSMLHGVDEATFRPIDSETLDGIVKYLADNRDTVWTDTYGNVGRYMRERMLAKIRYKDISDTSFYVRLSLPRDVPRAELLTVPLTLMVELDGRSGENVKAYDGDTELSVSLSRDGKFVMCDVVPDGTWIRVLWGE
jgi:peptidoglycan/xylan/chitin deacetylase (PgdA/CDA1 family)